MVEDVHTVAKPVPEAFDFPTAEEIDLATKTGVILLDDHSEDFSQLAAILLRPK